MVQWALVLCTMNGVMGLPCVGYSIRMPSEVVCREVSVVNPGTVCNAWVTSDKDKKP